MSVHVHGEHESGSVRKYPGPYMRSPEIHGRDQDTANFTGVYQPDRASDRPTAEGRREIRSAGGLGPRPRAVRVKNPRAVPLVITRAGTPVSNVIAAQKFERVARRDQRVTFADARTHTTGKALVREGGVNEQRNSSPTHSLRRCQSRRTLCRSLRSQGIEGKPPGQRVADCAPIDWYTKNLDYLRTKTKATGTLLTGNYNAHHKKWLLSKKTDPPGRHTLTLCTTHGLSQLVNGVTHRKGNRLDFILSDTPSLCTEVHIDPEIYKSDHYLLSTSISCSPVQEKSTPRKIWIYQEADWDTLRVELAQAKWDTMLDPDNPELSCINVTRTIQQAMVHHIPRKTLRSFTGKPEWYNESCEKALQKKHKICRQYKANKTPDTRSRYNEARNGYTCRSCVRLTRTALSSLCSRVCPQVTIESNFRPEPALTVRAGEQSSVRHRTGSTLLPGSSLLLCGSSACFLTGSWIL
ncbi:hypothetical protein Bbelb_284170 [Branchiostoma belcheri]|nr:hypothetical protein Bbelb_284170 [Branchiostoma belcheri]